VVVLHLQDPSHVLVFSLLGLELQLVSSIHYLLFGIGDLLLYLPVDPIFLGIVGMVPSVPSILHQLLVSIMLNESPVDFVGGSIDMDVSFARVHSYVALVRLGQVPIVGLSQQLRRPLLSFQISTGVWHPSIHVVRGAPQAGSTVLVVKNLHLLLRDMVLH